MQNRLEQAFSEVASPAYIFSEPEFAKRAATVKEAFGPKTDICFSIKANPFLLAVLPDVFSKIEVCSPGELEICRALNIDPSKIIFSGVNKSREEIDIALDYGVSVLTVESYSHLNDINASALERGIAADVLLRLSCESQFGMDKSDVYKVIAERDSYPGTNIVGLHYFTGTQKTRPKEITKETARLIKIVEEIKCEYDFTVKRIEYGTGLAVDYFTSDAEAREAARLADIAGCIRELSSKAELTVEMGRFFAAPCGYYVSRVADVKRNDGLNYAIIDGGLHQLKYDGQIQGMQIPVITHIKDGKVLPQPSLGNGDAPSDKYKWTLCGSLCTTADVIARNAVLPGLAIGDRLVFHRVGAYSVYEGFSMFLSRDLPSVYLLDKTGELRLVRDRIESAQFNLADI